MCRSSIGAYSRRRLPRSAARRCPAARWWWRPARRLPAARPPRATARLQHGRQVQALGRQLRQPGHRVGVAGLFGHAGLHRFSSRRSRRAPGWPRPGSCRCRCQCRSRRRRRGGSRFSSMPGHVIGHAGSLFVECRQHAAQRRRASGWWPERAAAVAPMPFGSCRKCRPSRCCCTSRSARTAPARLPMAGRMAPGADSRGAGVQAGAGVGGTPFGEVSSASVAIGQRGDGQMAARRQATRQPAQPRSGRRTTAPPGWSR